MKQEITQNIRDPEALERLFRQDPIGFGLDFPEASAGIETDLVRFWRIRLTKESAGQQNQPVKSDLWFVVILSVVIALLVKAHLLFGNLTAEEYWSRNLPTILFAGLTAWFTYKRRIKGVKYILLLVGPVGVLALFLNLLPDLPADTTVLAAIHAPLFMWFIFGLSWISFSVTDARRVSAFLRYTGELVIMYGLLCLAGGILSGMTIALFSITGLEIAHFYMENLGIVGLAVFPVLAAWLIDLYPEMTRRIAPVIARIFTPLVLVSAIIYLVAITLSGIDMAANREFLIMFNLLLVGVMAIIVFSLSELDASDVRKLNVILLFLLAAVTLIIDFFALSAIVSRLSEGFTPNRTAVLISNLLVLLNLMLILPPLFFSGFKKRPLDRVERILCRYLPVYFLYCAIVIFVFPFLFGMA